MSGWRIRQSDMQLMCAGDSLVALVDWLQIGSVDREAALLRALLKAPLPARQPSDAAGPGKPSCLCMDIHHEAVSTPNVFELNRRSWLRAS